jgi:hypothetical protein
MMLQRVRARTTIIGLTIQMSDIQDFQSSSRSRDARYTTQLLIGKSTQTITMKTNEASRRRLVKGSMTDSNEGQQGHSEKVIENGDEVSIYLHRKDANSVEGQPLLRALPHPARSVNTVPRKGHKKSQHKHMLRF